MMILTCVAAHAHLLQLASDKDVPAHRYTEARRTPPGWPLSLRAVPRSQRLSCRVRADVGLLLRSVTLLDKTRTGCLRYVYA